jgi:hypothetical protein
LNDPKRQIGLNELTPENEEAQPCPECVDGKCTCSTPKPCDHKYYGECTCQETEEEED